MNKLLKLLALGTLVVTPITSIIACDSGPSVEEQRENWEYIDAINNLGNLTYEETQDGKFLIKSDKFEFTKTGEKQILIDMNQILWLETKLYGYPTLENQWGYEIASYISLNDPIFDIREEAINHHNKVNEKILYAPDDILLNNGEGVRSLNPEIEIENKTGNKIKLYFSTIFYDFSFWYFNESLDEVLMDTSKIFNQMAEEKKWPGRLELKYGSLNFSGADLDDEIEENKSYFSFVISIFRNKIVEKEMELRTYNRSSNKPYIKKTEYVTSVNWSRWSDESQWIGIDIKKQEGFIGNIYFDTAKGEFVDVPTPIRIPINNVVE